ncbi:tautomerase family protein [Tardiphaga sp.]|uniref:tautomerase family protein n=1 Tax=Tardiphaga sp. TaxID=1926292 RepID=UPI0026166EED|nr:tautomerase family protein [Tardiphaga sp.]MDB5617854.1 4-oxalocrotonate tautomerase [Tardiphaga sp.]
MPLVRINLSNSYSAEERQIIGDTVYSAMVDIAKAPAGDKFLIFTRHADGELIHPAAAFMGMEYTSKIVFVQVFWVAGRSTDVKKAFYRNVADTLNEKIGIRKEDVWINLVDCAREDWSFGNGDMQYAPK